VSGVNVLELACQPEHFEELSRIVHEADQLKRPVVRNRKFTLRTAPLSGGFRQERVPSPRNR
jgi:hypothetical protein